MRLAACHQKTLSKPYWNNSCDRTIHPTQAIAIIVKLNKVNYQK
ncbi:hypothetical protein COO91_06159 [Nostoc flagelliforme CCNUN1]|uniref:Uncharacterized protein n=1 Tax=Nostoc flagelliforme CCNUN1 TaxID=2038116 RepID=A0A2K8SZH0_9NOSO|nr:hypothetical protein COO91_06159 [Nostoc flagelliforme CCNUN1]